MVLVQQIIKDIKRDSCETFLIEFQTTIPQIYSISIQANYKSTHFEEFLE
jgi:hypothetical protein